MLSDKQHIDDFFRQKEEGFTPDEQHMAANWQQMQKQLADPGPGASLNQKNGTHVVRKIGKFLGGLLAVAIVAIVAINLNRPNKKASLKTTEQQETVVIPQTTTAPKPYTPDAISQTTKQPLTTVETKPTVTTPPVVKKTVRYAPAMELVSPPVTKEQPSSTTSGIAYNAREETKVNTPDAQALMNTFFEQLRKEEQAFYVQAERDTTVIANEGTRLFIAANSLMTKAGPVKGKVKIVVREYYRNEDIIAAKLHTTSNGQQLVTGGMVHISAQQDGEPVTIALQQAITINMPTKNYDSHMQLFTGQEVPGDIESSSELDWIPAEGGLQPWSHAPVHNILALNINEVEPYKVSYRKKTTAKFYVSQDIFTPGWEIIARLKQRFGSYYDVIKLKRHRTNKDRVNDANAPIIIDSTPVDIKKALATKKLTRADSLRYVALLKQDSVYDYRNTMMRNTYSFAITSFGWINCDKFLNDPQPKVNMTVNFGKGTNTHNYFSMLVFTRYRSMVKGLSGGGHKAYYQRIPADEPAVLITVTVIDDKVVSNMQPVTTSGTVISDLVFEPTTPEQFKQKLQSLFAFQPQ